MPQAVVFVDDQLGQVRQGGGGRGGGGGRSRALRFAEECWPTLTTGGAGQAAGRDERGMGEGGDGREGVGGVCG